MEACVKLAVLWFNVSASWLVTAIIVIPVDKRPRVCYLIHYTSLPGKNMANDFWSNSMNTPNQAYRLLHWAIYGHCISPSPCPSLRIWSGKVHGIYMFPAGITFHLFCMPISRISTEMCTLISFSDRIHIADNHHTLICKCHILNPLIGYDAYQIWN